jgi:protein-disulfide isomerase
VSFLYLRPALCLRSAIPVAWFVIFSINALGATAGASCTALGNSERTRLLEYVKKKYKLPQRTSLTVSHESFVGATCFRKLEFKSADPKSSFLVALFLSSDFRFLARELLDSSVDPILEERRKQQALAAGLTTGNFPSRGPRDARVSITVFSDFQCPYCAKLANMLNKEVLPAERKTTRLVFRHFPLSGHNWALAAAQATACAQEQGDDYFWRMHDFIFERQREFTPDNIVPRLTEETRRFRKFDSGRFAGCVAGKKTAAKVDLDLAFGTQNGVTGTPAVFINGQRVETVAAPEQLRTLIRESASQAAKTVVSSR